MSKSKKNLGEQAAETTTAFNPMVGVQGSELMRSFGSLIQKAAENPTAFGAHFTAYSKDMVDIMTGSSEIEPGAKDRRFKDSTWSTNPLYKGAMQSWFAFKQNLDNWVDDIEMEDLDRTRAHFVLDIIVDSLAPTNSLAGNPAALKRMYETGGASIVRGMKNAYDDVIEGRGLPKQVDSRPFKVGGNIAISEGAVIFRNEMMELIQYKPLTDEIFEVPLLMVPPQINKFYVSDLTPEKSMIRHLVSEGIQVFVISWRNPTVENRDWGLEAYIRAAMEAIVVVKKVTRQKQINLSGACSGGITTATLLSHLASIGDDSVAAITLQVCVLDSRQDDTDMGSLMTDETIEMARRQSAKKGVMSGDDLGRAFAWMRPNDLIWNYVVNNYLLGDDPPAFDILFWNNDSTNLTAALHSDYLDIAQDGRFGKPGEVDFMGHPIDLTQLKQDCFLLAGTTDHITPWKACYRTLKLLGGDTYFHLSNSGHIQSLLNPPGHPKAQYFVGGDENLDADAWLEGATQKPGSWWIAWSEWLGERGGKKKTTPKSLGNKAFPVLADAPGTYVHE